MSLLFTCINNTHMTMELHKISWIAIHLLFFFFISTTVRSADFETIFMPGEVIEGHAEYESECTQCHSRFKKSSQKKLCLDCHEETAEDIFRKTGFHGRNEDVHSADCKSCHSEHKGRNADIIQLNLSTFNHKLTDFELEGSHKSVSCENCHKPDKKYSEAPLLCFDCHGENEPHQGNLGEQCDDCHSTTDWQNFKYDHDETDFPLEGSHKKASCNSCHINEQYEDIPQSCNSCHFLNDIHSGRNGTECEDCHNPEKWDESTFDHKRDTEFPLKGKHSKVSCTACHKDPVKDKNPPKDCYSCHKLDDQHQGRNGEKCASCHNEKSWQDSRFDHDKETDFPLKGKHKKLSCGSCHQGDIYTVELSPDCVDCHRGDDVHQGQEGENCSMCHQETGWSKQVIFDHDLTRFPLIGLHATTPCEECHLSPAFKNTAIDCIACHKPDDVHKLTQGPKCGQCHNPNAWALWEFDHNTQTDFSLDGAHEELVCEQCHIAITEDQVHQSSDCYACHAQDDEHRGRFGRSCERCHNTESFSDVTFEKL